MRFLLLTQYYPPEVGAAQTRLSAFAHELQVAGHDVQVVTALPNYPGGELLPNDRRRISRSEVIDGIPVRRLWLHPATGAGLRRLASYLSFTATGLVGALGARPADVIFVESPPLFLGVAGWLAARRHGAAFILNISDLWPDSVRDIGVMQSGPWLAMAELLELWLYRRATAVTAVTDGIRARLIATKGLPEERVLFLPNGADLTRYRPLAPTSTPSPSRPLFVYAGNHGYAHGLDVLIDAAAHAPELDFDLVGDGSEKARLQAAVRARRLTNVHFEPPMPEADVSRRYAGAVAGLSTLRRSELMSGVRPAKVLAIMACGRPVLYSGSGEGADLVRAAGAGIVVEPEDPAALADAARRLAADPEEGARMGANGRRFVKENLAWPALVSDWLEQLDRLPNFTAKVPA